MYSYNSERLGRVMAAILKANLAEDAWSWLQEKGKVSSGAKGLQSFNMAFAAMPRKTGKEIVQLQGAQQREIEGIRKGLSFEGWTADRLARVWLLLQLSTESKEEYIRVIENLFKAAEMNEMVALYSALPVLAYPEEWISRCAEGIRSNIGDVLASIMCRNPYPSEHLDENAWNQLVLKAFFTEQPVNLIIGIDERSNQNLANTLSDYAHERWAAHRTINPQIWRSVTKYITPEIFPDIERIAQSENTVEREAAALVCAHSDFPGAKALLEKNKELREMVEGNRLTWDRVAKKNQSAA